MSYPQNLSSSRFHPTHLPCSLFITLMIHFHFNSSVFTPSRYNTQLHIVHSITI